MRCPKQSHHRSSEKRSGPGRDRRTDESTADPAEKRRSCTTTSPLLCSRRPGSRRRGASGGKQSACNPTRSGTQITLAWILSTAPDAVDSRWHQSARSRAARLSNFRRSQLDDFPRPGGRLCGKWSIPGSDPGRAGSRATSGSQWPVEPALSLLQGDLASLPARRPAARSHPRRKEHRTP